MNDDNDAKIKSKTKKEYIKQRRYKEAEEIAKNYPNNEPIQSKLLTIYIKQKRYKEAEKIAKKHPNYEPIQSQLVTVYIKQKRYKEAEEIAKKHPNHEPIQSQLVTIYMKQRRYEEAEELAKKYPNYEPIQSQLVTVYIKQRRYKEAEKIAKKHPNHEPIQSQLVTVYIKQRRYEEAEKLAKKHPNHEPIQSQLVTVYIKQRRYKEAEKLAKKYPNHEPIQSQLVTVYIKQERYKEAEELAKKYPNHEPIQSQLVTVYIKQRRYKEAEELAKNYPNNEVIQLQFDNIRHYLATNFTNFDDAKSNLENFSEEIRNIRSKLSLNKITYSDIEVLNKNKDKLDSKQSELIKLAIYDKLGYKKQAISSIKNSALFDSNIKKILIPYFENKKAFFDLNIWDNLIGWDSNIDEYQEKIQKEEEKPQIKNNIIEKPLSPVIKTTVKSEKPKKRIIQVNIQNINSNSTYSINKKPTKNKSISSSKKDTIYDILNDDYKEKVFELKVKYYADMGLEETRKSAIYKYDRLEDILASKPSQNNLELLLLMLVGDMKLNIEQEYPKEYSKILQKINVKKSQYQSKKDN